ncbi:hypothetical protein [Streptococcus equi]|uniref:hypothetical protein n=1 Tax=Streptococcus equi TaxID=1336 RepID=UPI000DA26E51|nr:hypothetical protein [Streptococcus equi]MCD3391240.1 hypothetical protein [Streptococcus equi subsp. zooepidemicus]MCD3460755.1 hypothetical protein [Streptococcus equi subsp. zooepidemicus]SQF05810.1 Uncharacterised protein [Streptococcus equi subsp. zooepidemicus]HEK9980133.1 hypothetical protein [Streptococcus equi subsp. zooepidemicus]HEL0620306.1 hypothetical protein [Streptococcus equi subsp. zooepidemicus]
MNSLLSKPTNTQALTQVVSPYQLEVARKLSQSMADNQARELLATDILYKVGNLALIQAEILKNNPEAQVYTDYILRAFTHYTTQYLR